MGVIQFYFTRLLHMIEVYDAVMLLIYFILIIEDFKVCDHSN